MSATSTEPPEGWLDFRAAGARLGAHAWLELRLFEVLGGWVAQTPEPEVKLVFAELSHHHAAHARLWEERLPRTAELDPVRLIRPDDDAAEVVAELTAADPVAPARVEALRDGVLPALVRRYETHRAVTSPVSDGPVRRALGLVLGELEADRARLASTPTA